MSSGRLNPNFLQELKDNNVIYAVYGCCISSDSNHTIEECEKHIDWLNEMRESLEKLNWKDKEEHLKLVDDGIKILKTDIETLKDWEDDPDDIWGQD